MPARSSWTAVYTLVLDRDATRGDLTGWASVTNRSGAVYRDAALSLVAGNVNRVSDARLGPVRARGMAAVGRGGTSAPAVDPA